MKSNRILVTTAAVALALAGISGGLQAQTKSKSAASVGRTDLSGVVTSPNGPEAGVWVIAETRDLPTKYAKIVVTDDQGRYFVPDLPKGSYDVWVRGYGLVDSPKVKATPGKTLNLQAVPAPSPKEAAAYYPAMYWFSLMRVPQESEFPIGPIASQGAWVTTIKQGACQSCHALGTPGMRAVPEMFRKGGEVNSVEAWRERLKAGSAMAVMAPKTNTASTVPHPVRDPKTPSTKNNPFGPSPYWGAEPIWDGRTLNHNPMMDEKGRVWFTSRITPNANPDFCKEGSTHPSAKVFPIKEANRHLSIYEPA